MSTKYVKPGHVISWDNDTGSDVAVNQVVLIPGQQVAVAEAAIANGYNGPVIVDGIVNLASAAVTITADDPIYCALGTSPACTNVPTTALYFIGWAEKDAASAAGVNVRLAPFSQTPNLGVAGRGTHSISSASSITVAVATHLTGYPILGIIASAAGAQAIAFPALAEIIPQGSLIWVKKTGSAGAVTITAGTGTTIVGGATVADQDAQNDYSLYMFVGTEWLRIASVIA